MTMEDVTVLMDKYNSELSSLLDKHAPVKERVFTLRPATPWYTEVIIEETDACAGDESGAGEDLDCLLIGKCLSSNAK